MASRDYKIEVPLSQIMQSSVFSGYSVNVCKCVLFLFLCLVPLLRKFTINHTQSALCDVMKNSHIHLSKVLAPLSVRLP